MPKLKPETHRARREHILDAAELCFARSGFHGSSMQDICTEAGVSAGALYGHFNSKEDLIAGITERDRARIADQLAGLADAPDIIAALTHIGEYYTIEEPAHKRPLWIEIGAESTRDKNISQTFNAVDEFALDSLENVFAKAKAAQKINADQDPRTLALLLCIIGDGLFWRRAIDPKFDANTVMPAVMALVRLLLKPDVKPAAVKDKHPAIIEEDA